MTEQLEHIEEIGAIGFHNANPVISNYQIPIGEIRRMSQDERMSLITELKTPIGMHKVKTYEGRVKTRLGDEVQNYRLSLELTEKEIELIITRK